MKFHQIQNVQIALEFLRRKGVRTPDVCTVLFQPALLPLTLLITDEHDLWKEEAFHSILMKFVKNYNTIQYV